MKVEKSNRKFALGQLAMTKSVYYAIPFHEVMEALRRHESGDWGDVCKEDWELNDDAVDNDARLLSVYRSTDNVCLTLRK